MSTDPLSEALYQRDKWERQAYQLQRELDKVRGELNHERLEQMSNKTEQQGDVIERMLDASEVVVGDSWRSYCAEDQANSRKAMTAAARVLLYEALDEIEQTAKVVSLGCMQVTMLQQRLRARILPASKPDAAVEAVGKVLADLGIGYKVDDISDSTLAQIVAAVRAADTRSTHS
jgi:uncharacterized membrane protein YcjF (UPF0283 family)